MAFPGFKPRSNAAQRVALPALLLVGARAQVSFPPRGVCRECRTPGCLERQDVRLNRKGIHKLQERQ
jgi:hypothetical protein